MNLPALPRLKEKPMLEAFAAYAYYMPKLYVYYYGKEGEDNSHLEMTDEMWRHFEGLVAQNSAKIIHGAYDSILEYINFYDVKMTEVDEFKYLYFIGREIAKLLNGKGKPEIAKVVLYGAVLHLEQCYNDATGQANGRKKLRDRLKTVIEQDKVDLHLGKYGMYLLYKCGSNMIKEYKDSQAVA